jgi:hypothetical protein
VFNIKYRTIVNKSYNGHAVTRLMGILYEYLGGTPYPTFAINIRSSLTIIGRWITTLG